MDKDKLNEILESIKEIKMLESELHKESLKDLSKAEKDLEEGLLRLETITGELCNLLLGIYDGPWKVVENPLKKFMNEMSEKSKKG